MKRKLQVIVADDEEFVRRGLSAKIAWERLGLDLVAAVSDGQQVLDLLATTPIDIVVTDIMMPEVDGLSLIEEASRREGAPRFVILSGYGEFEFAQRAMAYGVQHYVLKPTKPKDLETLLLRIGDEIRTEENARREIAAGVEQPSRQESFRRLLSGELRDKSELAATVASLEKEIGGKLLYLLSVELGEMATPERSRSVTLFVERTLGGVTPLYAFELSTAVALLVVADGEPTAPTFGPLLQELRKLGTPHRRILYSPPFRVEEAKRELRKVANGLELSFYVENGGTARLDTLPPRYALTTDAVHDQMEAVDRALRRGEEGIGELLRALLREAAAAHLDPGLLKSLLIERLVSVGTALGGEAWDLIRGQLEVIEKCRTLDALETQLVAIGESTTERVNRLTVSPQDRAVRLARSAVDQRYGEHGLCLKYVAEQVVYANADYLSRIFRKTTGKRFTEYLLEVRMSAARKLLVEFPQLSVGEVADRVGFGDNSQYFSTTFRRFYGVSPSSLRDSSGS